MIGWVGNILLALCGVPLAIEAYRKKKIYVNPLFLLMWTAGELLTAFYVIQLRDYPLMFNYIVNVLALSIVWRYYDRNANNERNDRKSTMEGSGTTKTE